jgi:hypothetical protein
MTCATWNAWHTASARNGTTCQPTSALVSAVTSTGHGEAREGQVRDESNRPVPCWSAGSFRTLQKQGVQALRLLGVLTDGVHSDIAGMRRIRRGETVTIRFADGSARRLRSQWPGMYTSDVVEGISRTA